MLLTYLLRGTTALTGTSRSQYGFIAWFSVFVEQVANLLPQHRFSYQPDTTTRAISQRSRRISRVRNRSGNLADKASHSCCVGFFYIYDMGPTALLPLWRKCVLGIFITRKNPPSSVGLEPATEYPAGSVASTLTARPPILITIINYYEAWQNQIHNTLNTAAARDNVWVVTARILGSLMRIPLQAKMSAFLCAMLSCVGRDLAMVWPCSRTSTLVQDLCELQSPCTKREII
jgi:hypothetical protein